MPPVGFAPPISAGERHQTYALDRAATGIGELHFASINSTSVSPTLKTDATGYRIMNAEQGDSRIGTISETTNYAYVT
jgi:hypothetical protein